MSPFEKKAYDNLKKYDGGEYQVKHAKEIEYCGQKEPLKRSLEPLNA
jgi:hypothetical protein